VITSKQTEAYQVGVAYLQRIHSLLPDPQMVDVMENLRDRVSICNWIGNEIEVVNKLLQSHLNACHDCFEPIGSGAGAKNRRSIDIFAVPLAASVRLDGFCNITAVPTTILVDVGRVSPPDWLALVAHEYAHAHLGYPGHDLEYAKVLSHLCLGLGLPQLSLTADERSLYYWPPYPPTIDPLSWWRGEN
jgi:hypothetical protein